MDMSRIDPHPPEQCGVRRSVVGCKPRQPIVVEDRALERLQPIVAELDLLLTRTIAVEQDRHQPLARRDGRSSARFLRRRFASSRSFLRRV